MAIPGLLSIIMSLTCFVSLTMSLEGGAQEPTVITAALTELAMTETKEPWFRVTLDSNIKTESAIAVASVYSSSTWTIPIPRLETNLANSVVVYNHSLPMFPCRNDGNITAGIGYYCLCRNGCFYQSFNHINCSLPSGPSGRISDAACPELVAIATQQPPPPPPPPSTHTTTTHSTKTYGTRGGEITFCCAP